MSFSEHSAPILRAALEVLRDASRPLQPNVVRDAIAERVEIAPEHLELNAHGQTRWWAQLGFRTGEAAALGWMVKRNGWSITEAGVQALEDFPGVELYRELTRQYRARPPQRAYADPRWKTVLKAMTLLEPGTWTTYGDLAALVGMSAPLMSPTSTGQPGPRPSPPSTTGSSVRSDGHLKVGCRSKLGI